ncbi:DUF3164 family protein [Photobacterium damselae]|uniref:DUF3164 family protein n=1 Tax=Photobacterium damselae TaxID=38293 RepID=UPI003D7C51A1
MSNENKAPENKTAIPDGYMKDRKGRLVPVSMISDYDMELHAFVNNLCAQAVEQQKLLREFKLKVFGECNAFLDLLAEKYNRKPGGAKGNVTFSSFDGRQQVTISVQNSLHFGPELQVAKDIIDECINEWSVGANENLTAIINDAFEIDKEGQLNTGRILSLRRLSIKDERWERAMKAIGDSILVASSKTYIRFRQKDDDGKFENIPLDIAAL